MNKLVRKKSSKGKLVRKKSSKGKLVRKKSSKGKLVRKKSSKGKLVRKKSSKGKLVRKKSSKGKLVRKKSSKGKLVRKKSSKGKLVRKNYPEFKPNLSPRQIFKLGSFGGTYWRPIYSSITKKKYKNQHEKYPESWWEGIDENKLVRKWEDYDVNINKYKVRVGTTLEFWESKKWITEHNPYGWVQWYCDFYKGKRGSDDERQVKRWVKTAGPNSRFRKRLINLIKEKGTTYDDFSVSPKIRQTLQHWGYKLTKSDMD